MTIILGINAYHGDSSACLVKDGKVIAAVEEERLRRVSHWAGFPTKSVQYCMSNSDIRPKDLDHVAYSRNPMANLASKLIFAFTKRPNRNLIKSRLIAAASMRNTNNHLNQIIDPDKNQLRAKIHWIEHHRAHSASAFHASVFDEAAAVSIDSFGDFRSTMVSLGQGNKLSVLGTVDFPHSLGILYTAVTQYLGFLKYGDEYKVMGLAAFGQPTYIDEFRNMVQLEPNGKFKLDLRYFLHSSKGVSMTWNDCEPEIDRIYSDYMAQRLGPPRIPSYMLTERHNDLASSLQAICEEVYFHVLNYAYEKTGKKALTLAGGVAFNSVANGKILDKTPFEDLYIQPAAGDAGTAIGSAYYVHHVKLGKPRRFVMDSPFLGPEYDNKTISKVLDHHGLKYKCLQDDELNSTVAAAIANGQILGWFQGRAEWGPRALGNRSILVDPRRDDMRDILNKRIKMRETFRPFAPAILLESVDTYFERSYPDPFMSKVYPIRPERQAEIPAVTHVDGTGRLQTVSKHNNPRFWNLIKEFEGLTGVPILLNTSFNENEPIVCSPEDAVSCFLRTQMDLLVLNNYLVTRN